MEFLKRNRPDVLVSDIAMPGDDGYVLIAKIRALPPAEGGDIPALALTAHAGDEDRRRALEAGYHMHVAKPVEPISLLRAVESVVGRRSHPTRGGRALPPNRHENSL